MSGEVAILNVGHGDTKLTFDPNSPADSVRAARIVKDMLRRGFALLVQVGTHEDGRPKYQRALDFDEGKCEYIIADFDSAEAAREDQKEAKTDVATGSVEGEEAGATEGVRAEAPAGAEKAPSATGVAGATTPQKRGRKRLSASGTSAVAVGRSAGG
jgi:hypothetical protein